MKIYFENGRLLDPNRLAFDYDVKIDAGDGLFTNEHAFEVLLYHKPNATVYTNSLVAFEGQYCWNKDLGVPELYIRAGEHMVFTRIDELTNRELREGHNLLKLYRGGEFAERSSAVKNGKWTMDNEGSFSAGGEKQDCEEKKETFYVSYKANGVYQAIIVNAPSVEIARECFENSMSGTELLDCREATNGDMKPGMPVMDANKYYKVEISHMASMGLTSGNTYTYWADKMPDYETVNKPMVDIHTAYFKDPVEAEDYRQHCLLTMGVTNEKVLADNTIREGHADRKPALDEVVKECEKVSKKASPARSAERTCDDISL